MHLSQLTRRSSFLKICILTALLALLTSPVLLGAEPADTEKTMSFWEHDTLTGGNPSADNALVAGARLQIEF